MSKKDHDKFHKFVNGRDGAICQRCRKSDKELKKDWKKIHPRKKRQMPFLLLHHIDGDERFPHSRDGRYCGNLNLQCHSCNSLLKVTEIVHDSPRQKSPEMVRSDKAKPAFNEFVNNYLANFSQVCKMIAINRGAKVCGVSSVTITRYLDENIDYDWIEFVKQDHGVECSYSRCNDYHICLPTELPRKVDLIGKIIAEEPQFSRVIETKEYGGKIIKS